MKKENEAHIESGQAKKPAKKSMLAKMEVWMKRLSKRAVYLLFPDDIKCTFCGRDIPNFDERPYCDECAKTLPFNNGNRCIICDQPIESKAVCCDFCQTRKKNFKRAFCPFLYEGAVKNAILAYKDSNQRYRAKAFAKMIVDYMQKSAVKIDVITYIPMTPKKEKARTFNQSKLLAEEIGKILDVPVLTIFSKVKDSTSQKTSTYKQRFANVTGMYEMKKVRLKRTQNVLIVDDVITTCATVGYCAGLISPRVNDVYVCGIAREYVRNSPVVLKNPQQKKKRSIRFNNFSFNP